MPIIYVLLLGVIGLLVGMAIAVFETKQVQKWIGVAICIASAVLLVFG